MARRTRLQLLVDEALQILTAVHSANPISEMRKRTLERLTTGCTANIIYVTAFLSRDVFRKFARDIAWETEVWIAEAPDHLIHYNGDKFLGPHAAPGRDALNPYFEEEL